MNRRMAVHVLDVLLVLLLTLLVSTLFLWRSPRPLEPLATLRPEDVLVTAVVVLAARWWLGPPRLPVFHPPRLVAVGVTLYAIFFSFVTVTRHRTFKTHALDLGQYAQNIWHLAHGREPYDTILGWHAWGNHLSPVFYLLIPGSLLFNGPVYLLVLQSIALALGAVPLYLLARPRLGTPLAGGVALLYLLNPSLHGVNVRDFHPTALAIPLLLTAMYALEARRPLLFAVATLLTLTTREDAALAVVGLGLWVALAHRCWLLGAAMVVASIGWLFVAVHWLMPRFRDDAVYPYIALHYGHLGRSLGEVLLAPLRHPLTVLTTFLTWDRLRYLGALLAPLALLPLLAPLPAAGALPALAQNLLAHYPVLFNHRSQYQAFVLPFLLVAAVAGLERLRRESPRARWVRLGPGSALIAAALVSLALSARAVNDLALNSWRLGPDHRAAYGMLARIPSGATVSAAERFFPHLYERTEVWVFPRAVERSDWVLVDDRTLARAGWRYVRSGDRVTLAALNPGAAEVRLRVEAEEGSLRLLRRSD